VYLDKLDYVWAANKDMTLMGGNSIGRYLKIQQTAWQRFSPNQSLVAMDTAPKPPILGALIAR
jgi:hypothetical protein